MLEEKRYDPTSNKIFVFGSNRAGFHGAGAALYAKQSLGAIQGIGEGPMPGSRNPRCYAVPTKDEHIETLSIEEIRKHVDAFLVFARHHIDLKFFVTRLGCGLAGYSDVDIAPLFLEAPINCELPNGWERGECFDSTEDQ